MRQRITSYRKSVVPSQAAALISVDDELTRAQAFSRVAELFENLQRKPKTWAAPVIRMGVGGLFSATGFSLGATLSRPGFFSFAR